jgi:hypothetical protein
LNHLCRRIWRGWCDLEALWEYSGALPFLSSFRLSSGSRPPLDDLQLLRREPPNPLGCLNASVSRKWFLSRSVQPAASQRYQVLQRLSDSVIAHFTTPRIRATAGVNGGPKGQRLEYCVQRQLGALPPKSRPTNPAPETRRGPRIRVNRLGRLGSRPATLVDFGGSPACLNGRWARRAARESGVRSVPWQQPFSKQTRRRWRLRDNCFCLQRFWRGSESLQCSPRCVRPVKKPRFGRTRIGSWRRRRGMHRLRAANYARTNSAEGLSSVETARGAESWTGNRLAYWKVTHHLASMGGLLLLGAYPSGV